jgi:hypothetical protein
MTVDEMFPRKYATGEDLQGKAVAVVIEQVRPEKLRPNPGAPEEQKWVLYVAGGHKGIVICRTLAHQIAEAVGEQDTERWPGKRVTLFPEPMMVAGKQRIAIRARAAANGNGRANTAEEAHR